MSEHAHLSIANDPELAAALANPPPPISPEDLALLRKGADEGNELIHKLQGPLLPSESEYRVEIHIIPVDGGEIKIRTLTPTPPQNEGKTFPLFFWMHGGGWSVGDIDMDDYFLRRVCVDLQVSIANVDYRLAPEYPFPTGLNDCYTALKWATENAPKFSASLSQGLIVGGQSAGGNIAAAVALRARDDPFFNSKQITGQFLQVPAIIHPDAYPEKYKSELLSMEQNKDAPILNRSAMITFFGYLKAPPEHPDLSVLLAVSHQGLPPTYFQISGLDPLRDEGLLYEKVLREAGVKTKLDVYPGLPHGGQIFLPALGIAKKVESDFEEGLRWLLANGSS